MSLVFALIFGGFLVALAGVKNISVLEALRGNFDQPKT